MITTNQTIRYEILKILNENTDLTWDEANDIADKITGKSLELINKCVTTNQIKELLK